MDALIRTLIEAEMGGDTAGAVSMYTDDVEHDVVGWPAGPVHGPDAAKGFGDQVVTDFDNEDMAPTRCLCGEDFCVIEHACTGTVPGAFLGILATAGASASACSTSGSSATAASAARTSGSMAAQSPRS